MHIKAAQTNRSAASTNSESKLKQYCNSRHVTRQTKAYYIITSQLLGVLWQHKESQILTAIHKKSPGLLTSFSANSVHVWRFESLECF